MVIDTNNINSSGASSTRSRTAAPVAPSTPKTQTAPVETTAPTTKDNVVLSSEAQKLVSLQAKINSLPDVNLDRVATIKKAIAEGRFEINPERIAENMLKQDELLG